jgi:hypothetical protein
MPSKTKPFKLQVLIITHVPPMREEAIASLLSSSCVLKCLALVPAPYRTIQDSFAGSREADTYTGVKAGDRPRLFSDVAQQRPMRMRSASRNGSSAGSPVQDGPDMVSERTDGELRHALLHIRDVVMTEAVNASSWRQEGTRNAQTHSGSAGNMARSERGDHGEELQRTQSVEPQSDDAHSEESSAGNSSTSASSHSLHTHAPSSSRPFSPQSTSAPNESHTSSTSTGPTSVSESSHVDAKNVPARGVTAAYTNSTDRDTLIAERVMQMFPDALFITDSHLLDKALDVFLPATDNLADTRYVYV